MEKYINSIIKTKILPLVLTYFLVVLLVLLFTNTNAQWSSDPAVNTVISTATGFQSANTIVSDGSGGAIVTWEDLRNGGTDIYAQCIDASGNVQWATDGVAICTQTDEQTAPTIVSDGSGGAIIIWQDVRNGIDMDIYAQRINASGIVQWTTDGVAICTTTDGQFSPAIVSDGLGGAIVTWQDLRNGGGYDIYAQRINSSGLVQWTANGIAISTVTGSQYNPAIVSDGSSGAIITWQDTRNSNSDIYAQCINAAGVLQWTANGTAICTATFTQSYPKIVSDGLGGAIIAWHQDIDGMGSNFSFVIYAQRINATGVTQWTANGVAVSSELIKEPSVHVMISDGSGGAIIAWQRTESGFAVDDIYAQQISAAGVVQWTANGVAICATLAIESNPTIVSDGLGGAIIAWKDDRVGGGDNDIYAQHINTSGAVQWAANGIAISTFDPNYQEYGAIVSDGSGGAIIAWSEGRNGIDYDIYAQNVCANGALGVTPPQPPINITTPIKLNICSGNNTTLSISGVGTLAWYSKKNGGNYLGGGNDYTTPVLDTTTTFYAQDSLCAANGTRTAITVTVNALPTIIVAPNINLCVGQNITLSPVGATDFVWSPAIGLSSSTGSTISASPPPGVTSYTVTGTDVNGCTNHALVTITMYDPVLLVSSNVSVCSGESATLTCSGFDTYTWLPSTGLNASSGSSVQSDITSGTITYTVTGTYTLVAGCLSTASVSVTMNSPTAAITANKNDICSGDSARLTATGTADTYLWSTGATGTAITIRPMTTANYTLTLSKGACFDSDVIRINVTTTPTASIIGETSICSGKRVILSAESAIPDLTLYLWSNGTSSQSINAIPLTTTTYSVVVANGVCKDTASLYVNVTTTPTLTLTSNKAIICGGESVVLSASAGSGGADDFLWSTGASGTAVTVSPLLPVRYSLKLSNGSCSDTDSILITVIPLPTASISGSSTVCSGNSTSLTASAGDGGGNAYLWSTGETTVTINIAPLVNIVYSVTANTGNGLCTDTASINITPIAAIPVSAGPDVTMAIGLDTVLSANNGTTWNWTPKGRLNCYTCQSTIASPLQTTNYIVTITDINGCVAEDSVTIYINPCAELYIPGAFSPNNDGINDVLYIRGTDCIDKIYSFTIFNRWGEKVFETMDSKAGWNGSQTKQTIPSEVFIYFLDGLLINGETISKRGNVTLLR